MNTKPESDNAKLFYHDKIMPCCLKPVNYLLGPRGRNSQNITCSYCGQNWNLIYAEHSIDKI